MTDDRLTAAEVAGKFADMAQQAPMTRVSATEGESVFTVTVFGQRFTVTVTEEWGVMFFARMSAYTRMAGVVFQVVDFGGGVVVVTRDSGKAVKVAALMNAGRPVTADVLYG
jgi:hypothetical protein